MSERMTPMPFAQLMEWALAEKEQNGGVFGLGRMFRYPAGAPALPLFSSALEAPFGPAAGPHTQLSQNILAAYVAGARFFELKTVQTLDGEDLPVSKPCIIATDECYNCEWSTELRVPQAFEEYVKAWYAIKLLAKEWQLGDPDAFIFNMSVGYDLEGIGSPKIDAYIEGMKNAAATPIWQECRAWIQVNLPRFARVNAAYVEAISPVVSRSITLSTLHGCPPEEIERIATYLVEVKELHTYVKCNPTLLGYGTARARLNALGYDYVAFDDHHFKADLQFLDAVPMLRRLQARANALGLAFGVKLTNTFPVDVTKHELPSDEMYMSGRALFPLTIAVAEKISGAFDGSMPISFSGGADAKNILSLLDAGVWPVTAATTLLKPGGYQRLSQMAGLWIGSGWQAPPKADTAKIHALSEGSLTDAYYRKPIKPLPRRKVRQKVPLSNCFLSPCSDGCPIRQDIPAYLQKVAEGQYLEALKIITDRNPLPFITGTLCPHRCMDMCKRNYYEHSVGIRGAKLEAAEHGMGELMREIKAVPKQPGKRAAVVGGGAAGLAAAFFLAREGVQVTIFEAREAMGGIVRHVIPSFRIGQEAIDKDVALVRAMGVEMKTGVRVQSLRELKAQGFTHVILACGAWEPGRLPLKEGEALNVLKFLEECRAQPLRQAPGKRMVIIGGGNTAMDAARMAKRLPGAQQVRIVYRRDRRNMPADEEELGLALEDCVEFCELLSPVAHREGSLLCDVMELSTADASGRRRPQPTGRQQSIPADVVIAAVGESVDEAYLTANHIALNDQGRPQVDENLYAGAAGVYVIGDAHRGPATVVEAIADAMKVAHVITGAAIGGPAAARADYVAASAKKGDIDLTGRRGPEACLSCQTVCESCVDVCPNRANLTLEVPGAVMHQIVHVDGMCNECGNCEIFCPWDSAPYKEKLTLYWTEADFADSKNEGFLFLKGRDHARVRLNGEVFETDLTQEDSRLAESLRAIMRAVPTEAVPGLAQKEG